MLDKKRYKFIRDIPFEEVVSAWAVNEDAEHAPHWESFWKNLGYKSWTEWRKPFIDTMAVAGNRWGLYQILEPVREIPQFRGGAYAGWAKNFYGGKHLPKFSEMKQHPTAPQYLDNFPKVTTLIAWITEQGVVIIEGMHRCATFAFASKRGVDVDSQVYLVAAECSFDQVPDFITNPPKHPNMGDKM